MVLFGIVGTFIAFGMYILITVLFTSNFDLKKSVYDHEKKEWESLPLDLEMKQIVIMCALLCSSDVIAAVSLINPKE